MIQENGMPIKFQAWNEATETMIDLKKITPLALDIDTDGLFIPFSDGLKIIQAIGATDSSDPPQELYVGDLIEFNLDKKEVVGEIIWLNFSVWVRLWRNENTLSYLSMSHVLDFFKIKKLGSSYDHPEILKKAGLEKS